jgi:tyrosinase
MTANTWGSFISQLDNVHGAIHGRISGDMGSVSTAGYDPIFYFHHCNVDRLGAIWQTKNPGQFAASEASVDLVPFTKPYTTSWHKGGEFEDINALDYKYQTYCFILPHWPIKIFEIPPKPFPFPLDNLRDFTGPVRLHLERAMMPEDSVEIRVFINAPEANENTAIMDNPNFAGTFGVFGMGKIPMGEMSGSVDLSLDITDALKSAVKKRSKETTLTLVPIFTTKLKLTKAQKMMQGTYSLSVKVE